LVVISTLTVNAASGSPRDPDAEPAPIVDLRGNNRLRQCEIFPTINFSARRVPWRSKNARGWTSARNPLKFPISRMQAVFRQPNIKDLAAL
jgi:hypothetical protein